MPLLDQTTRPQGAAVMSEPFDAFLIALDRWSAFCRLWDGLTPGRIAEYERTHEAQLFAQGGVEARAILADLDLHGRAVARRVAEQGGDVESLLTWLSDKDAPT